MDGDPLGGGMGGVTAFGQTPSSVLGGRSSRLALRLNTEASEAGSEE